MIDLRDVTVQAGTFRLERVSFAVQPGDYAALMGRTGRGKTTLLEAICGLRSVIAGQILLQETDVTHWAPGDRQIGYVPQDLALFPTMSVRQHFEFALRLRHWSATDVTSRVAEVAEMLGVAHLLDRRVKGLSGGESQRVALGRALSFRPQVLLLDEPLSALDQETRQEMYGVLKSVKQATGVTVLHVTHNREDAEALANRTLLLHEGQVQAKIVD
jgi:ABC-type sugar transport system ATPase subunit